MKTTKFAFVFLLSGAALIGCDDTAEEPTPDDPANGDPVNVLVDQAGFSHLYDDVKLLSSASSVQPYMDVLDYTLEGDTKLNLAYFYSQPTQQDALVENERISIDINTKTEIPLPAQADTLNYSPSALGQAKKTLLIQQFRPYSNFFTYATSQFNGMVKIEYMGDVTGSVGPTPNPTGVPDFGFRFPVTNVVVGARDNAFAWYLTGIPNPTYTLGGTTSHVLTFLNRSAKPILTSFAESDIFTYGKFRIILVKQDSVMAYDLDDALTTLTERSKIAVTLPTGANIETRRHYSTNGKILGMLIKDSGTKKIWTCSYNFDTNVLTPGLNGVTLDFSGEGSDFDLDEFGNVWYTGFASNGSNTNGVSIYKKSVDGAVSVIGADNLLKFGTVVKLKTLGGKIYLAVTGKHTGTNRYQLSILKQD